MCLCHYVKDNATHLSSGATAAFIAFTRARFNKDVSFLKLIFSRLQDGEKGQQAKLVLLFRDCFQMIRFQMIRFV
jgi:hypothetical protein